MTDLRIASSQPLYNPARLGNQGAVTTPGAQMSAMAGDRYDPVGGNGPEYQALVQQTDQMLNSRDPQQLFQAIINMTRMQPADALPRLQRVSQTPGLDPRVYELAQRGAQAMQGMAQQPAAQQPGAQQPAAQQPGFTPAAPTSVPTYQGAQVANLNPNDAQFMIQNLRIDLDTGGPEAVNAVKTLMGIAQANPAQKELVFTLLLNHMYSKRGPSATEAVKALASMNDPRFAQYLQMVQRDGSYESEARDVAIQTLKANASNPGGPGVASTGGQSVEFLRAMEFEIRKGGAAGAAALQQVRTALGANPSQSPLKAEAQRILLTVAATGYDPSIVVPAIQMVGELRSREMNALQYLDAIMRNPAQTQEAKNAARQAIQQIMASP